MLLNAKLARLLPLLILEREEHNLGPNSCLNPFDSSSLVLWRRARSTVALTRRRPARLHDVDVLARADLSQIVDLCLDEVTRVLSLGVRIEERVQVSGDDIDDVAPGRALVLPDGELVGRGDAACETRGLEGLLRGGDEAGEVGGGALALEDGLVADNDQLDEVPLGPFGNGVDLGLGTADARPGDEDAEDDFHAVGFGGATDVFEGGAVGAVDTD